MKDIYSRKLNVGDLVLVGSESINKKSVCMVISEDRVFDGGTTPLTNNVYLIESPNQFELARKNELMLSYKEYQTLMVNKKRKLADENAKKRKEIKKAKIVKGDILSDNFLFDALYLGNCKVYNKITNTESEGHTYLSFARYFMKDFLEKNTATELDILSFFKLYTLYGYDNTRLRENFEKARKNNADFVIEEMKNVETYKSLSTKYKERIGHINILNNIGDIFTLYTYRTQGRGWSAEYTYGNMIIKFME